MKRIATYLMTAALFVGLVQCGGADAGPATSFSDDSAAESGEDGFPAFKNAEAISLSAAPTAMAVNAGYAGNGTTIDIPSDFEIDDCRFTAAIAQVDGSALSTRVSVNTETGEVVCEKVVQEREDIPPETKDCVAAFTIICVQ